MSRTKFCLSVAALPEIGSRDLASSLAPAPRTRSADRSNGKGTYHVYSSARPMAFRNSFRFRRAGGTINQHSSLLICKAARMTRVQVKPNEIQKRTHEDSPLVVIHLEIADASFQNYLYRVHKKFDLMV